jgi:hypothetical protein
MPATSFNPVSVHANDLDHSVAFEGQLFAMRRIASPTFPFPVQWLCDESAFFPGMYELPDGSAQMYLRDPADNLIEIDWPDARALESRIREDLTRRTALVASTPEAHSSTLYVDRRDGGVDQVPFCGRCGRELDAADPARTAR